MTNIEKIEQIEKIVCSHYQIDPTLIRQKTRIEDYLLPRQLAVYFCNEFVLNIDKTSLMERYGLNRATYYNCIKSIRMRTTSIKFLCTFEHLYYEVSQALKFHWFESDIKFNKKTKCGVFHFPDWYGKCMECGKQIFIRKPKQNGNSEAATAPDADSE